MSAFQPPLIPAPTNIRRDNPRFQGEIGLTDAIAWFGHHGYRVCIPLADNQPYDLVVDAGDGALQRVQVKTTTHRSPAGRFVVQLAVAGGNQSFHTVKKFDPQAVDLLYVLTDAAERYLIPVSVIRARTSLALHPGMAQYRL